jgi:hypothetical protein
MTATAIQFFIYFFVFWAGVFTGGGIAVWQQNKIRRDLAANGDRAWRPFPPTIEH